LRSEYMTSELVGISTFL